MCITPFLWKFENLKIQYKSRYYFSGQIHESQTILLQNYGCDVTPKALFTVKQSVSGRAVLLWCCHYPHNNRLSEKKTE